MLNVTVPRMCSALLAYLLTLHDFKINIYISVLACMFFTEEIDRYMLITVKQLLLIYQLSYLQSVQ